MGAKTSCTQVRKAIFDEQHSIAPSRRKPDYNGYDNQVPTLTSWHPLTSLKYLAVTSWHPLTSLINVAVRLRFQVLLFGGKIARHSHLIDIMWL